MESEKQDSADALPFALVVLGASWKGLILNQLLEGTSRFGELKKTVAGITQKVLAQHLRDLEIAGLVTRKIYPEVPPRVEYSLTPHGQTLAPALRALAEWGRQHQQYLQLAAESSVPDTSPEIEEHPPMAPVGRRTPTTSVRIYPSDSLSHEALTEAIRAGSMG